VECEVIEDTEVDNTAGGATEGLGVTCIGAVLAELEVIGTLECCR
jgi:hypothetical protein